MEKRGIIAAGPLPAPLTAALQNWGAHCVPASLELPGNVDRAAIRVIVAGGSQPLPTPWLAQFPGLSAIAVHGVGIDGIDRAAAERRNIRIHTTPDALVVDVAEHAIGLLLSVLRKIPANDWLVRSNEWRKDMPPPLGRRLAGRTIGILGFGRIGRAIASRLEAWDVLIHYASRQSRAEVSLPYHGTALDLFKAVDTAIIAVPGGDETRALVGARELAALGSDGILVNVARGSVVDPQALSDALGRGSIAGAGLDVFDDEPAGASRFASFDNVVLQPHQGSATLEARDAMREAVLSAVATYLMPAHTDHDA